MITTSHFLAATLNSKLFVDLYVELQQYLSQFSASDCIEFQNILSLHITLYYFPKDLTDEQLNLIKDMCPLLKHLPFTENNFYTLYREFLYRSNK